MEEISNFISLGNHKSMQERERNHRTVHEGEKKFLKQIFIACKRKVFHLFNFYFVTLFKYQKIT